LLAFADAREARKRFLALYKEADQAFDLARCEALLAELRERIFLFTELSADLEEREDYLETRVLFLIGTDGLDPGMLDDLFPPSPGDVHVEGGVLQVIGNDYGDTAIVNKSGSTVTVTFNDWEPQTFDAATISRVHIAVGDGNDLVQVSGIIAHVEGGGGDDMLIGSELNDTITGGAGNDVITGNAGDDRLNGGGGRDKLRGLDGNDRLYGGDANDQLEGGNGIDRLYGDAGNDFASGGGSNDRLYGGEGSDSLVGGKGADLLYGENGDDVINAADGTSDLVDGGNGSDKASKGPRDNDQVFNVETYI